MLQPQLSSISGEASVKSINDVVDLGHEVRSSLESAFSIPGGSKAITMKPNTKGRKHVAIQFCHIRVIGKRSRELMHVPITTLAGRV